MLFDISLLMASHIKSVRDTGEYLYRLDCMNGLTRKELERLIEILLCINQDCENLIGKTAEEELETRY